MTKQIIFFNEPVPGWFKNFLATITETHTFYTVNKSLVLHNAVLEYRRRTYSIIFDTPEDATAFILKFS